MSDPSRAVLYFWVCRFLPGSGLPFRQRSQADVSGPTLRELSPRGIRPEVATMAEEVRRLATVGEMVLIPTGYVFYSDPKRTPGFVRDDYYIDVFPVTNQQYRSFLLDHPEVLGVPNIAYVSNECWEEKTRMYPVGTGDPHNNDA